MDVVLSGLQRNADHLIKLLLSPGSEFSLTSLAFAFAVAAAVTIWHGRKPRRVRMRALMRVLFPRRVLRGPSTKADIGYFMFNTFVYAGIFGSAAISYQFLTNTVIAGMVFAAGPARAPVVPEFASRAIITAMLFLAYELGYWIDHFLKHRIPALWELHKVHHSAEVLTPLTTFRVHPLDTWIFGNIVAITAAITNGMASYLFGDTAYQYALSGNNILLVVFVHLYVHLQHTHVWISFRGWLGRIFLSPAHHQIHHSTNPVHFNKNLGSCLALWDWLFGTLYIPGKKREKLTFGVEPGYADAHTMTGEFLSPIGRSAMSLASMLPRREDPLLLARTTKTDVS